jgi:ATP-dependent Clp protease ATP-binding subunit ClpA
MRLSPLKERLYRDRRILLDVAPEVIAAIARKASAEGIGGGGLIRWFDTMLAKPVTEYLLTGTIRAGDRMIVSPASDGETVSIAQSAETRY